MASEPFASLLLPITRRLTRAGLLISAACILASASAKGDIYISTMHGQYIESADISSYRWAGFSFTTDGQDYYLDRILAGLSIGPTGPSSPLEGRLYRSDVNGFPSPLLSDVAFSHTAFIEGEHVVFFTPAATVELLANTTYTFVLTSQRALSPAAWGLTSADITPQTDISGSSWSVSPFLPISENSGGTWSDGGAGSLVPIAAIYATPTLSVPEPSAIVLLGVAGALGWSLRRRRAV